MLRSQDRVSRQDISQDCTEKQATHISHLKRAQRRHCLWSVGRFKDSKREGKTYTKKLFCCGGGLQSAGRVRVVPGIWRGPLLYWRSGPWQKPWPWIEEHRHCQADSWPGREEAEEINTCLVLWCPCSSPCQSQPGLRGQGRLLSVLREQ